MQEQLKQMIEHISGMAEFSFKRYGQISAVFFFIRRGGDEQMCVFEPPYHDKDMNRQIAIRLFQEVEAVRYVFVDECWTLAATSREEALKWAGRIQDHPQRIEQVIFSGEDELGSLTATRNINRPKGKKPRLGPLVFSADVGTEGRLTGLLAAAHSAKAMKH